LRWGHVLKEKAADSDLQAVLSLERKTFDSDYEAELVCDVLNTPEYWREWAG
jgi:hypothetical protein